MHAMQETTHEQSDEQDPHRESGLVNVLTMLAGMLMPLLTQFGHHH